MTTCQRIKHWMWRFIVNFVVVLLLAGAAYLIYYTTVTTVEVSSYWQGLLTLSTIPQSPQLRYVLTGWGCLSYLLNHSHHSRGKFLLAGAAYLIYYTTVTTVEVSSYWHWLLTLSTTPQSPQSRNVI